jgi:ABC-type glycerol-3-phosphate transport system permease component
MVVLANAVLIVVVFMSIYPMCVMVLNSFKSDSEVSWNPAGLPVTWTPASYQAVLAYHGGLLRNFLNSVFVAGTATMFATFFCSMAAFAFSKYRFRGRDAIFAMLLATMMVPSEITVPPLFLIVARLGWMNTYQAQIVPLVTSVFGLFMMRQYMLSIPDALFDAARIDGAGNWRLYREVMVPVAAPVLGAFAILHFMGSWNSYLWPLIVASDQRVQPIMVVLPNIRDPIIGYLPVWGTIMAGCVLATLPLMAVFIAFQDVFLSSVVVGSVKE